MFILQKRENPLLDSGIVVTTENPAKVIYFF